MHCLLAEAENDNLVKGGPTACQRQSRKAPGFAPARELLLMLVLEICLLLVSLLLGHFFFKNKLVYARKGVSNVIKWIDMSKSLHGRNFEHADAGRGRALGRLIFFMASDMGHFLELNCFLRWTHFLAFHRQTLRHRAKRDARLVKKVFGHYAMAIMQQRSVRRRNTLVTTFLRRRTLMFLLKVQE